MAVTLHCSPPSNILTHGIEVTGEGRTFLLALLDAIFKLGVDVPAAEAALRADAQQASCPYDCSNKSISNFFILKGITFRSGYDPVKDLWHVTIGLGAELDVLCE